MKARHDIACAVLLVLAATGAAAQSSALQPARLVGIDARCRPVYPPAALRAQLQGTTLLDFVVDPEGMASRATVVESAGPTPEYRAMDDEAASALTHCPFKSATDGDGRPVSGHVRVTYNWVIESPSRGGAPGPHPAVIHSDDPACRIDYPAAARQAQASGVTVLWYRVDAQGRIVESHVAHGSGPTPEHALLDRTALEGLAHCPVTPGFDTAGHPAETAVQMDYRWNLQ